ncbi:hypothetical protein HGB07_08600, partial [Candidatus Roizmanbacteria bacterium]|nr:hypothetical protein [Candidatus Roizmanbacteria bacterium]
MSPVYVYECPECKSVEEHIRKFSEMDAPTMCAACMQTK